MSIDDLLLEFGTRSGLGPLRRNAEGLCRLVFDERYVVDIEAPGPEVRMAAIIAPMDEDVGIGTLKNMLGANLIGADSGGATLALDTVTNTFVVCRCLPSEGLSYATFEAALQGLVNALQHWREELQRAGDQGASPLAPTAEDTDYFVVRA